MTFPPRAVFKDQVLGAELDPQHDPDTLTTGLQANESRQGEGWQEKTLRCTDHSVHRRFRTPLPCAQMLTSCHNPLRAQTTPIIIPPSSERGGEPPRDPPSLIGWFRRANPSSSLSLAKTGGKLLDWPGGVVTSRGPPLTQSGKSDWPGDGHLTRCTLIGRGPPRGSSLNSAHHDVGQSTVKEAK